MKEIWKILKKDSKICKWRRFGRFFLNIAKYPNEEDLEDSKKDEKWGVYERVWNTKLLTPKNKKKGTKYCWWKVAI